MKLVLLLARPDHPTDGVADYCQCLTAELKQRGHSVDIRRLRWDRDGWVHALWEFSRQLRAIRPDWTLVQFTHLMWSRHGFSAPVVALVAVLRMLGSRIGVVLHDPLTFSGTRFRDWARQHVQALVMRTLARLADRVFVTVAPGPLRWCSSNDARHLILLPVGSSIPASQDGQRVGPFTVAVFGVTEGPKVEEIALLTAVLRRVGEAIGKVRLLVVGRGSEVAEPWLRDGLTKSLVQLEVGGMLSAEDIGRALCRADAMLFTRGGVSSRRSSVVAGIACGMPVVGLRTEETEWPITEAGVVLSAPGDAEGLASALVRIAEDDRWARELRDRSWVAYEQYFEWGRIAERLERALA